MATQRRMWLVDKENYNQAPPEEKKEELPSIHFRCYKVRVAGAKV